jgi:predicted peptidase
MIANPILQDSAMPRLLIGALAAMLVCSTALAVDLTPGKQIEIKGTESDAKKPAYNYLLFAPANYDKQEKWPLIVFLHGSGEKGDDLNLVKKHGPPKIVDAKPDFEFLVLSPQAPAGERWDADKVVELVDQVSKSVHVDPDRIYLTGLSMGGVGTWSTVAKHPDRFAAIVPICGIGEPETAEKFKHVPCWVFHGAKDTGVPLARSEEMVAALTKAGAEPKFTVYPEAGHDSWTEAYNTPELYQWLLQQKRK